MREEEALLRNIDPESEEFQYSSEDLENLRLGALQHPVLDNNPVFVQLRGKLVTFYKKLELHELDPEKVRIDNLNLKKTLNGSLKKLLRIVVASDDPKLQLSQLTKLFHWYSARADALESKEAAQQAKMREEQLQRRKEQKQKLLEQKAKTFFPPIKKGAQASKSQPREEAPKAKPHFAVTRNTVMGEASQEQWEQSPIKASYQSAAVIQPAFLHRGDGGTGGAYSEPALCYLTTQQEQELDRMLELMDDKDREYAKHQQTVKKAWVAWGKAQAGRAQRAVQILERAHYGSNFQRLGESRAKSLGDAHERRRLCSNMTEQQFLHDPSSPSDSDADLPTP